MRKLIVFGFWGDPSGWSVQQYVLELPRYLGNREEKFRVVDAFCGKKIYNFSSTLALVEGIIAGWIQAPNNPLVEDLKEVLLHIFIPDTLVFGKIQEEFRGKSFESEDELRKVFRNAIEALGLLPREEGGELIVKRGDLARIVLNRFIEVLKRKRHELAVVLEQCYGREAQAVLGLRLLDKVIEGVENVYRDYSSTKLHPFAYLGEIDEEHGIRIRISLSLYPVALSNALIVNVGNDRKHVLLSVRRSNVGIFEDVMMCSLAVPVLALVYEALKEEPRDVAIVVDTTHGLNYAMVNYLRGLDLALRLVLIMRAIEEFIDKGVGEQLTVHIAYYNSDPAPQRAHRSTESRKTTRPPEVSLKLNVVRVDTIASQGSALHVLDTLRSLVFSTKLESVEMSVARRLSISADSGSKKVARLGMAMISALCNAMPLWLAYFSKKIVEEMNLDTYVSSINLVELFKAFSRAIFDVAYKIKVSTESLSMTMDVELGETFGSEGSRRRFLPTIFTLTFSSLAVPLYRAFRARNIISIVKVLGNETVEELCLSLSDDIAKLLKPLAEYSTLKLLENDLAEFLENYTRRLHGTHEKSSSQRLAEERHFFAHSGLAYGIIDSVKIFGDPQAPTAIQVCIEDAEHSLRIASAQKFLLKHFIALTM